MFSSRKAQCGIRKAGSSKLKDESKKSRRLGVISSDLPAEASAQAEARNLTLMPSQTHKISPSGFP
jgi:hypothetical protein